MKKTTIIALAATITALSPAAFADEAQMDHGNTNMSYKEKKAKNHMHDTRMEMKKMRKDKNSTIKSNR